ncbi:MAG: hypothetical protein KF716_22130 [Anaerolineae bacterium]|nr:hypothetical protein [Anaerolineae bacterium]
MCVLPDIQAIRDEFRRLHRADLKEAVIALLVPLVNAKEQRSTDDIGWAYWNICDCYAMLRQAEIQQSYQADFFAWCKTALPPLRRHWVLSDGTQAMTLINGGFGDFWWDCYQDANENAPHVAENRTVRFESHRANAAAHTYFREFSRAEAALRSIEEVLSEDSAWTNRDFATVTLITLQIEFYAGLGDSAQIRKHGEAIERYLDAWFGRFQRPVARAELPFLGTWEQLNADRPPEDIYVALHNAACALVVAKQFEHAEPLFRRYLDEEKGGMTDYSKALYLLACWNNRRDKVEIHDLMSTFQNLTPKQVVRFAPDLSAVLAELGY